MGARRLSGRGEGRPLSDGVVDMLESVTISNSLFAFILAMRELRGGNDSGCSWRRDALVPSYGRDLHSPYHGLPRLGNLPILRTRLRLIAIFISLSCAAASAQNYAPVDERPPALAREFRAAWIATV